MKKNAELEDWYSQNKPKFDKMASENQQLRDWYAENKPIHDQMLADYAAIKQENTAIRSMFGFGVGAGIATVLLSAFVFLKFRTKLIPRTARGQQFLLLTFAGLWCSACCLFLALSPSGVIHPINAAVNALLLSSPALIFGGLGFWWLASGDPKSEPPNH